MTTILDRLERTLVKAIELGDPAAEISLVSDDIRAFEDAVKAFPALRDPAINGPAFRGVPITENNIVSHLRTIGTASGGYRARRIAIPPATGEAGWAITGGLGSTGR